MKKTKGMTGEERTFKDYTEKSWFMDGQAIKVGDNFAKIMAKEFETLEVGEIVYGDNVGTWKIVFTKDDRLFLLKTSKELK